jgi:transcriptional regulator with GAF, ATPase, and Fis domain
MNVFLWKRTNEITFLSILKKTNGKIRGEHGAAKLLEIPPTTLHSKMKKLGIKKTRRTD